MTLPITEHTVRTARHTSFHLACGPEDGPLLIFVHGWPELSISWRHQLRCFGALGFRAIAPDMRGYGRSSVPSRHEDYALPHIVEDMRELLAALGRERAIWVGHDWGSPVVWSLATHHAAQCQAIASLCVPYLPDGFVPEALLPYVDRKLHPVDQFPAGQWEYQLFYAEHFERASATFDADPERVVRALFRRGSPEGRGKPSRLAFVRRDGGWFGGAARVPDFPRDTSLLSEEDMHQYASALSRNGFFGPDSWYVNAATNGEYARRAPNPQRIDLPVLFLHARDDYVCETLESRLADPMRAACPHLTEHTIASGHWMAQERPVEVNGALAGWLARLGPDLWP